MISVSHLSKKYCRDLRQSLRYGLHDIAGEFWKAKSHQQPATLRPNEFWALRDVSFEVARGEAVAIIGANGAGKSTLLKVLYGLIKPDEGRVSIKGRLAALLELGTGFNPVLSGRQNVYVNAAILGVSRREVDEVMDAITDFAELADAMDTPVQYLSSGMKARLAYAVSAHLNPSILLVDEVLSVGDIAFQRKCFHHIHKYLQAGGSLLFVSHNTHQVQSSCQRGIVLERGQVTFDGTAVEALNFYFGTQQKTQTAAAEAPIKQLSPAQPVIIESIAISPTANDSIQPKTDVRLTLKYQSLNDYDIIWGFSVWTNDQLVCVTGDFQMQPRRIQAGAGELECVIERLPLVAGSYWLKTAVVDAASLQPLALSGWQDTPVSFTVSSVATLLNNAFSDQNQLVTLDVNWN